MRTLQSWTCFGYEEKAERSALRKKYKEFLPQAENRIMGYLAKKDLLVCSMTDDELFDLSAFINQEVTDIVYKIYNVLEQKAMQMRPVIITTPRRIHNKVVPDDGQLWLIPPS